MEAFSPEAKDSFRKPANETSRRNYRRHSPSSSHSPSPPSPGGWKRDRSPARAVQEDGESKRERRLDTENEGVRRDVGSSRKNLIDYRDSSRRSDVYEHGYSRRHSSHYDRSYHNTKDSRADSHRHEDDRYSKRSPERGVREKGDDESRYRRKENHVSERDRERQDRSDVRDRYRSKDHEAHAGRSKSGGKRVDETSETDLERSRYGKKLENGGVRDEGEGKDRNNELNEKDTSKLESENRRRSRDEEKGTGNHHRNNEKGTEHKELGERHGKKSDTTARKSDENFLSRDEGTEHLKEKAKHGKDSSKKEDKDKKNELPKPNISRFGPASESSTVQGLSTGIDNLIESKKSSSNMDEKLPKGSKWGPESVASDGSMATSDPEAARLAALRAAQQVSINLGGFKSVDEKKKMLWKSKAQEPAAVAGSIRWDTVEFADGDRREKFKKLMGVKGEGSAEGGARAGDGGSGVFAQERQQELQQDLEKQFTAGLRRRDGRTVGLGL